MPALLLLVAVDGLLAPLIAAMNGAGINSPPLCNTILGFFLGCGHLRNASQSHIDVPTDCPAAVPNPHRQAPAPHKAHDPRPGEHPQLLHMCIALPSLIVFPLRSFPYFLSLPIQFYSLPFLRPSQFLDPISDHPHAHIARLPPAQYIYMHPCPPLSLPCPFQLLSQTFLKFRRQSLVVVCRVVKD
ncbi:hypothetical protein B0H17DRAFT_1203213 [Mycena rosella]|uniref:Uncharacterized protein n=1 Tax=Mycena rosella TaxID=1033263 RepID=A0AAD7DBU5_MYCRO|nr:hypothetical protein B0H17DRAFT_1203213 [Mycena rosella]